MDLTWITMETTFEYIVDHRMVKAMNLNNSRITPNVSRMRIKWWTLHTLSFWGSRFQCSCLLIRIQIKCKHFEQTWKTLLTGNPQRCFHHSRGYVGNSGHLVSFFIKHTMILLQVIPYVVPNNQYSSNIPYIVYTLQTNIATSLWKITILIDKSTINGPCSIAIHSGNIAQLPHGPTDPRPGDVAGCRQGALDTPRRGSPWVVFGLNYPLLL